MRSGPGNLPYSGVPEVEPAAPPPEDYERIQTSPRQFGAQVGEAAEEAGKSAEDAATFYASVAATHAANQFLDYNDKLLNGDPNDPANPGLLNLKGADAMRAAQGVSDQIKQQRQAIMAGLPAIGQQEFERQTAYLSRWALAQAGTHARQQESEWALQGAKDQQDLMVRQMTDAAVSGNVELQGQLTHQIIDSQVKLEQARAGTLSPEMHDAAVNRGLGVAAAAQVHALARTDPVAASRRLEANIDVLPPDTYDRLKGELASTTRQSNVAAAVADPWGWQRNAATSGGGGNWETQHNNLGGIRKPGVEAGPNAGGFQSFATPEEGVAAISHQLDRYASGATTGQPLTTLRQIVSTWAPPNENDTPALIARAAQVTGFGPDQALNVGDPGTKAKLIEATIRNEQGGSLPVDAAIIQKVAQNAPAPQPQQIPPGTPTLQPTLNQDRLHDLAGVEANPNLSDLEKQQASEKIKQRWEVEDYLTEHDHREAATALKNSQTANEATLFADAIGGKPMDDGALSKMVRSQQISVAGYNAIRTEQGRHDDGRDDPSTALDLYRRLGSREDIASDIFAGRRQLSKKTAEDLIKANAAAQHADVNQVERADFGTLRTALGFNSNDQPMFSFDKKTQEAEALRLWAQAQGEWTRRVTLGHEDPGAVLADLVPRYSHHPEMTLPQPRMGIVQSADDLGEVADRTRAARDAGTLGEQEFQEQKELIVRYKQYFDAEAARQAAADAAAKARRPAPTAAGGAGQVRGLKPAEQQ